MGTLQRPGFPDRSRVPSRRRLLRRAAADLAPRGDRLLGQAGDGRPGNAIAVWECNDGGESSVEAAFRPAGGSFGPPQRLSAPGADAYAARVAVNARGDAVLAWERREGPNERIEAALRPAGEELGSTQPLSAPSVDAENAQVAIDEQGGAVVVWEGEEGSERGIEAAFRPPGGAFGPPQRLSAPGADADAADVAVDALGNAIAVRRQEVGPDKRIAAASRPAGGSFGEPQLLSPAGSDASDPMVATAPQGNAIAVWARKKGIEEIVEAAFRPAGVAALGAPQQISPQGARSIHPHVATYPDGDAIAAWPSLIGKDWRIEAAGFDAAGPQLRNLSIPATAERGKPASFSVSPFDVWSQVASTSWSFGDGASAQGNAVKHTFRKIGRFQVTVTSTDSLGNASTATATVRVRDTIKPRISKLRVTPRAVRPAGKSGRRGARGSAAPKGKRAKAPKAKIRFRLSEPARVTFTVKRQVRKRCGKRPCVKLVAVKGRLTAKGRQGANAVPFKGRVGGRALAPGRYVLTAQAKDPAGRKSKPAKASFRIAK